MKICVTLLLFLVVFVSTAQKRSTVVFEDFVTDHSVRDFTPAVLRAVDYIKKHHIQRLVFSPKRYDFYPDSTVDKYVFTSNNDEGLKRTVFMLSGISDLEIDGQGAEFIFHGYVSPFNVENSSNIRFRHFTIDWSRTFHSEGTIVEVGNHSVDVRFGPEYPYKIESGLLLFNDSLGNDYPYGSILEFDSRKMETAYMARDYYLAGNQPAISLSPGVVRIFTPDLTGTVGNVFVFNPAKRLVPAFVVADSKGVTFDYVTIYHCGGMGIVAQRSSNFLINHLVVSRNPKKDRVLSVTADATHFVNCSGFIRIDSCVFENQMDDATNIHGIYVQVARRLLPEKLLVELIHEQQYGFDFIRPGSALEFVHNTTMEAYDTMKVKSVKRLNKQFTEITFDKPLPQEMVVGKDVLAAIGLYPDVTISNSVIRKNRARGMLIGSRGKVIIERNIFHTPGAAILFEGDGSYWFEQAGVRDVTVRDNVFDNCNYGVWGNAVIQIGSGVQQEYRSASRYNRNIRIHGNTFNSFDPRILTAYSVQGLAFFDNVVHESSEYPNKFIGSQQFNVSDCSDIRIDKPQVRADGATVSGR
ncbi:MAG: right-handed parallel beta-helix repeat-containing protein [Chitinophagaceae bacterium]|nr:MAG: right-handed parallel beta-helix repeat-containing protein [Chitinophagaceae bacterium]